MPTKRRGAPNPPGYVCPKRKGQRLLAIHVGPDLAADVRTALTIDGATLQEKGEELFKQYAAETLHRAHNYRAALALPVVAVRPGDAPYKPRTIDPAESGAVGETSDATDKTRTSASWSEQFQQHLVPK